MALSQRKRSEIRRRVGLWFAFSTLMPIVFIVCAWGLEKWIGKIDKPIAEMFGTGDVIPLATLLLLGVVADIRINRADDGWLLINEMLFGIFAFALAIFYGAIKTAGVEALRQGSDASYGKLYSYAFGSFIVLGYAVIHATLVKLKLERRMAALL